jgi:hypothetical protein
MDRLSPARLWNAAVTEPSARVPECHWWLAHQCCFAPMIRWMGGRHGPRLRGHGVALGTNKPPPFYEAGTV